ncbi:ring-1,2-phenylacetyl-CoA epoxidase subunit PaaB [Halovenus aranensis]|uniref:Ring-1,2-phenylacetyl-CoA epoxidase subunit PaaB n=2 Tax=Halovenus aranensis TaxID=890420 RepID=A0A1G8YFJ0_9EURY|nr:PacF protein [Halovenus aranensis]SDK01427.1 ring-1,2-phenylacetyl-CoA epoxidase subunit PaaB [Halovenus aranensis]
MIWEVFRQQQEGDNFVHCRDVHAPDREMAKQFAVIQHGRRKPTTALWVAPQEKIAHVAPGMDIEPADGGDETAWTVFRQDRAGGYHTECGELDATGVAEAKQAALDTFTDDDPHSLWVVETEYIGEVTADDVNFGGTTNKSYRFAQTYNVDPAAQEVEASESEQIEAEKQRGEM